MVRDPFVRAPGPEGRTEVDVRSAVRTDLDAVLPVLVGLAELRGRLDGRCRPRRHHRALVRAHVLDRWFESPPFALGWIAVHEGAVVGLIAGEPAVWGDGLEQPGTVGIHDLWVHPAHRRRGLGRRLVNALREAARAAGFPRVEISALVRDDASLAFWRALGSAELRVTLSLG